MTVRRSLFAARSNSARTRRRLSLECLEKRELFAMDLKVGPGEAYATLQAAVDNASPGAVITITQPGTYTGSVNLSRRGIAEGTQSQPGGLTILGPTSGTATLEVTSGSVFFNSSPYNGDLRIANLSLTAPTATAGKDMGIALSGHTGKLTLENLFITDVADAGIEVLNSTGTFLIDNVHIKSELVPTPVGIRLQNYSTTTGYLRRSTFDEITDAAVVIDVSGTTQMQVMLTELAIGRSASNEFAGKDGVRVTASGNSVLNLGLTDTDFDNLPENFFELSAVDSSQVHARIDNSYFLFSNEMTRTPNEPAIRFTTNNTAQLALHFEKNVLNEIPSDGLVVLAQGTSSVKTTITGNTMQVIGAAADHESIMITDTVGSMASIHANIHFNLIDAPFGSAIRTLINGASNAYIIVDDNQIYYGDPAEPGLPLPYSSTAAALHFQTGSNSTHSSTASNALYVRLTNNDVQLPSDTSVARPVNFILRENAATGRVRIETSTAGPTGIKNHVEATNLFGELNRQEISASNGIEGLTVNSLLARMPLVLAGEVWNDTNKNGIYNNDENGDNTLWTMLTLTGTETTGGASVTRTTLVDGNGSYAFGALLPGTYTITLTPPPGLDLTALERGTNPEVDSNFRHGIRQVTTTLVANQSQLHLDAGLIPTDGAIWKNQILAEDVNGDGVVTPLDALLIIIDLNANGSRNLPAPTAAFTPAPFLDVDGNGVLAPLDALRVIIFLNAGGSGEGEAAGPLATDSSGGPVASSSAESTTPDTPYVPPEFFYGKPTGVTEVQKEKEKDALDAFFADLGA